MNMYEFGMRENSGPTANLHTYDYDKSVVWDPGFGQ